MLKTIYLKKVEMSMHGVYYGHTGRDSDDFSPFYSDRLKVYQCCSLLS